MGRYLLAGAVVAGVYIALTLLLSGPFGVPIQIAIPFSYLLAVCLHFALQRGVVFAHASERFSLSAGSQARRYVLVSGAQYAVTALGTALLPDAIDVSEPVTYVVLVVACAGATFVILRKRVFAARPA